LLAHNRVMYLNPQQIGSSLPHRAADSHKGLHGNVAVVGGDHGMVGAACLAARAALLAGAGRTYVGFLCEEAPSVDLQHPEIMVRTLEGLRQIPQLGCVVLGPGMGLSGVALDTLRFWLTQAVPLLLDADALNLIAGNETLLSTVRDRSAETVITPHPGEAARLWGQAVEHPQRQACALALAKQLNAICVLKGSHTLVAHPNGRCCTNPTGNAGLASAGTGDVLSGIIGSLIAQGMSGFDAACAGVFVHGAAADALVARGTGPIGLTASEVSLEVRNTLNALSRRGV
jgi:ADP-dependent NAD(P)H-hydrate dehydratase / NAD(P)H-hydrate epimerase